MDPGFRTPLLDFFRRGEVARDLRLLAAQGVLAPRAHEQLGLLLLLVGDHDPDVAVTAEETLAALPREALSAFLARADVPLEMRTFFAARGIEPGPVPAGDDASFGVGGDGVEEETEEGGVVSAAERIAAMSVAQRVTLAMRGSREERAILIRDPNRIVGMAVLSSAKVSEAEVEAFAKMASLSEDLLRVIAGTRAWIKNYGVTVALTRNPKTPVALTMNLLPRLVDKDLRLLSTDRNVPEIVRITARKRLSAGN